MMKGKGREEGKRVGCWKSRRIGRLIRGGDESELKIHFIHCGGRT